MSGLLRRFSRRRSAGPEGTQPPEAAEPETADAPTTTPAEPGGRTSLLTDPAADPRPAGSSGAFPPGDRAAAPGEAAVPGAFGPDEGAVPGEAAAPAAFGPDEGATSGEAAAPGAFGPEEGAVPGEAATRGAFGPGEAAAPAGFAPAPQSVPVYGPARQPEEPAPMPVTDLPAGLDPDELAAAPATSARRSRLRRRVGFLRAAREVLLRDLGGFVYELHRTARDLEHESHRRLRETKLARLTRVDTELHELELRLDDVRRQVVVREPGVGGECPVCGELFSSDAHYCSHCGLPLTESARRARSAVEVAPAAPVEVEEPPPAPAEPEPGEDLASTVELPPLPDQSNDEFRWPRRDAGPDSTARPAESAPWAAAPSDRSMPAGDDPTTAQPAAGGDATTGDISGPAAGEDATPGDATTAGHDGAPRDDATRIEPAGEDATAEHATRIVEPAAGDDDHTTTGDVSAAGDDPATPDDATRIAEPAAGDDPATPNNATRIAEPPAPDPAAGREGLEPQTDDLSPVERRS
jgi:hypothetical protein